MRPLVVTIDGPAGAGKTTVSRMLADRLGYRYIDTGALYRGVAFAAKSAGIDEKEDSELSSLCDRIHLAFSRSEGGLRLLLNGVDISDSIRTPEITMLASAISARPVVRQYLLNRQRDLGKDKNVVIEGRDMGTVVFPEAEVKFFLNASSESRAMRRYLEVKDVSGQNLESIKKDMLKRDKNDSTRKLAPLKPADDAVIIDSTEFSIGEVVDRMYEIVDKT
jgi:CMP/dCMP kinase